MATEFSQQTLVAPAITVPGRGRWKIGAAILAIAVIAQASLLAYFQDDRTFSKMSVLFVWPAALFCLAIWWTFFSAQSWPLRLGVWGAIGVTLALLWSIFAFDGVDGEMVPRWRYRWESSRKQDVDAYFAKQRAANSPATAVASENTDLPLESLLETVEGDWPGFRGKYRDGIVRGLTLRRDWDQQPLEELWRHPVGLAWSGFSVVGDFAFTQEQRGPQECVVCYRLETGEEVWVHGDETRLEIVEANGGDGPHGTPEFHEGLLYTLGGTGVLNCLNAKTGRRVWQAECLKDAGKNGQPIKNVEWGLSQSPLVVEHLVIVNPGGDQGRSTIAYDRLTGQIVWTAASKWVKADDPAGYASPHFAAIHGVPQAVIFGGKGIAGFQLSDGRELWKFAWENGPKVNAAQPIVFDDGSVLFGCGYGKGSARIDIPTQGDPRKPRWESPKFRPKFNDFVLRANSIYGLDDGILACIDVETGKPKWKSGRYGYGQLLLVEDLLLILSEQGDLVLVEAQPDRHRELARFNALDPICWNHLAIAHGKLLIRNSHMAVCYDLAE